MPSIFDKSIAVFGCILLFPILASIAVLILIFSGRPILYSDARVGQGGKIFQLLKFRTMRYGSVYSEQAITLQNDVRITPIGHFLRRFKLDEIPQLLNVIRGEMALVGPRPERPEIVETYSKMQRHILTYRPGLTSPASIKFRDEASILDSADWKSVYLDRILPEKLGIDLEYMRDRSVPKDIWILLRTVMVALSPVHSRYV